MTRQHRSRLGSDPTLTLHIDLPAQLKHPIAPRLRDLVQLGVAIKLARLQPSGWIQTLCIVGCREHRLGGTGEVGVDVVDLGIQLRDGDVVKLRKVSRACTGQASPDRVSPCSIQCQPARQALLRRLRLTMVATTLT